MTEQTSGIEKGLVLVLASDKMGQGDEVLGALLIGKFLKTFADIAPVPEQVVLYNSGVKLACEGAETVSDLKALEKRGSRVFSCGTCLNYFGLPDKLRVGSLSKLHEIWGVLAKRVK